MVEAQAQNPRDQRVARTIDRDIAPVWHDHFAQLIWRNLPARDTEMALDIHAGPGRTTSELLRRLQASTRVVALEPSAAMRGIAKSRIDADARSRVYLKPGDMTDIANMRDDSYDLVIANLVLGEAQDVSAALRGVVRVTRPGGTILATLPMEGTWREAEDLLREVLRDAGLKDAARRLRRLGELRPSGHELARLVGELGARPDYFVIEQARYQLLFQSGREFLFSPLVEHGPLRMWKAVLGPDGNPQEVFWRLKESIDTYFKDHVFSVTVATGLVKLCVPEVGAAGAHTAAETAGEYWRQYPDLDALWQQAERATEEDVDIDIDIEEGEPDSEDDTQPHPLVGMRAEDEAIFALLEKPDAPQPDAELDALLDQVLEFGPNEEIQELDENDYQEIVPEEPKRKGVDTLQRIRALLPPPPTVPPPLPSDDPGDDE